MSRNRVVATAVAATAASTLVLAGILFYFFYRFTVARQRERKKQQHNSSFRREMTPSVVVTHEEFMQNGGILRGLIVDENGTDVLYLRRAQGGTFTSCFSKVWFNPINEEEKEMDDSGLEPSRNNSISSPILEIPFLPQASSHHHHHNYLDAFDIPGDHQAVTLMDHPPKQASGLLHFTPPPPPLVIPPKQSPPPPPPPPPPLVRKTTPLTPSTPQPPTPSPFPAKAAPKQPAPPQPPAPPPPNRFSKPPAVPFKTKPAGSLPLPPKHSGLPLSGKPAPPPPPRGKAISTPNTAGNQSLDNSRDHKGDVYHQTKLKPLHWDKVPTNADHSMVWHEITDGSFRFDDELMEALFGYTAQNQKSTEGRSISSSNSSTASGPAPPAQVFILDPRKSQNTAIVLKSLAISRKEILDALQEGHGLSADNLEKLTKISPTPEEAAKIIQFDGNPTKLADAESFLYHTLKAIPSAFIRLNAMLFRSNYDPDVLHLKESLQTLELSCKELRTPGLFLKLLEAILKAGNRMNAGTARGNAQGFNLSALRKLSYVKSTDGKTTLLHFVVEQVIRSEGKRCANHTRNHEISSSSIGASNNCKGDECWDSKTTKEDVDKEYLMLGLPVVEGLSMEFSNVKKAATIDYENFMGMSPALTLRVNDIRQLVSRCGSSNERSGFVREMKGFLEECEEELKVVREEQARVMQLVRQTTEYYQAGASKDKGTDPLQLFGIVKDFLGMFDQVCIDISKKLQKKPTVITSAGSPPLSPLAPSPKTPVKLQNLQSHFVPQKTGTLSSESEDDF